MLTILSTLRSNPTIMIGQPQLTVIACEQILIVAHNAANRRVVEDAGGQLDDFAED
ncbi:hypothetical protein [Streptococcus caballi]|uniref:hypothetical protein n=1 Tax=Streptococcus caballi TaxID=439220 RepID=UPI00037B0ABE|nr:hypothetical protein [Streptococcus caballi]